MEWGGTTRVKYVEAKLELKPTHKLDDLVPDEQIGVRVRGCRRCRDLGQEGRWWWREMGTQVLVTARST